MELQLSARQTLSLSPQMMQSMELLQMGSQELLAHIQDLVQENPVLELGEQYDKKDDLSDLRRKLEWLESTDVQNRYYQRDDSEERPDPISNYGGTEQWEEHLSLFLLSQLSTRKLTQELEAAARRIIESLNENGYLDDDLEELTAPLGCSPKLAREALRLVQSLEPAGVGARDLSECLCLQLERKGMKDSLAERIARSQLDALSKNRYGAIAKQLVADPVKVREACDVIRTLCPKPGSSFASRENPIYITPDIIVVSFQDHFELLTNDYYFPSLSISGYYKGLMKDSGDNEVRDYLSEKMRQAKWVVRSIEQRRSTLMNCAQCIVELQEDFFRRGAGHLVPMTLADVARKLEIHESTVSRAVKDKYIQCSMGVYPLSWFFSRGLCGAASGGGENQVSPDAAKARIKKLIAAEDRKKPLSDQKLADLLADEGIHLSCRTVAKYRDELNIPGTGGRREFD